MRRWYAYVDESGDFGTNRGASRYVTLAAVVTSDRKCLERIPSKVRRTHLGRTLAQRPELKFSSSSPDVRKRVLALVMRIPDAQVVSLVWNKSIHPIEAKNRPKEIYGRLAARLATEVMTAMEIKDLAMIVDARPEARLLDKGVDSIIREHVQREFRTMARLEPAIRISRYDSSTNPGLQVADCIAGAIQRKWERDDPTYYDLISPRIVREGQFGRARENEGRPWPGY